MNVQSLKVNIQKELWEYKKTLFWLPIILAALIIVVPLLLSFLDGSGHSNWHYQLERISEQQDNPMFSNIVFGLMSGLFAQFIIIALFVQLYYFTVCLFDERRDLSVVFWRSLPVPDHLTIGVKLVVGALIIPAIFMLAGTVLLVLAIVLALIGCAVLSITQDISLWGIWLSGDWLSNLALSWLSVIPLSLWLLPAFAWLMLASMFANKAPFLWGVLPIVALVLIEAMVVKYFGFSMPYFANVLVEYFNMSTVVVEQSISSGTSFATVPIMAMLNKVSVWSLLLSGVFIYATYWLRVNKTA